MADTSEMSPITKILAFFGFAFFAIEFGLPWLIGDDFDKGAYVACMNNVGYKNNARAFCSCAVKEAHSDIGGFDMLLKNDSALENAIKRARGYCAHKHNLYSR